MTAGVETRACRRRKEIDDYVGYINVTSYLTDTEREDFALEMLF